MKKKTEARSPYLLPIFKHPTNKVHKKTQSVVKRHKKHEFTPNKSKDLDISTNSVPDSIKNQLDETTAKLEKLNLDKEVEQNLKPVGSKLNEEEKRAANLFKSEKDKRFVLEEAPKIMKKLLINQNGWRTYEDSSTKKKANRYAEKIVVDDKVERKFVKLMKNKTFAISFPTDFDQEWLKRCIARPILKSECFGYIYVYYVGENEGKKKEDKVIPFKIGRSVNCPKRIGHCEKENGEKYNVAIVEATQFYKHFETIVHDYFKEERIIRDEIKDGKTEWFYKKFSDIEKVIKMSKVYLKVVLKDKGENAK